MTMSRLSLLIFLSVFPLFHILPVTFASLSAPASFSKEGGRILYSSVTSFSVNSSMTVEVVDLTSPQVLPNGHYSDIIVDHAAEIVHNYLRKNGVAKFHVAPFSESFFSYAFDDVLLVMDVNIYILIPVIFDILVNEYLEIAKHYNSLSRPVAPESSDHKKRLLKVMLATIVVQEACANSYKFSESQALPLLEFIYRFGISGHRNGLAVQALYTAIPTSNLLSVYKMFVEHFDSSRHALPVLYLQIKDPKLEPIKTIFISFITRLYEKVSAIDHTRDRNFDPHASMLISSMISCNFREDFRPMIFELLQKVDIPQLVSSPRFAKSAVDISFEYESQNNHIVEEIAKQLIDDNTIFALDSQALIVFGSIISAIKHNQSDIYKGCFEHLSPEAQERLDEIEKEYDDYCLVISASDAFDTLEEHFASLGREDIIRACESIEVMIPVFPDFFKHQPSEANNVVKKALALVPELVNISMRDSTKDLDIFRFHLFSKLLELSFTGPYLLENTPDIFSTVIGFYNIRFNQLSRLNFYLKDVHMKLLSLVEVLVKNNKFFKSHRYRANFYTYLKMVAPRSADDCMVGCLHELLLNGYNAPLICNDVLNTSKKLELSVTSAISHFITNEIQLYLQNYQQGPIDEYMDGSLVHVAKMVVNEKVLSKTETILVKTVINRFSTYKIFTD